MSSLIIILITFIAFFWGYRVYARRFEALCEVDPKRPTPAITKHDGVDYVPAHHWLVLFGHHFSSIAGAGPIIGPVIACIVWGWLPALLWIIFGTIFIGGIHDFGTLFASLRAGGTSIADIAQNAISRKAKIIFSVFVWLALILVNAVFAYLCADTFVKEPKIVLPSLGLIPIALFVGYLLYKIKFNHFLSAVIGVLLLTGLIFLGNELPIGGAFTM
jgi:carbon starvation protein